MLNFLLFLVATTVSKMQSSCLWSPASPRSTLPRSRTPSLVSEPLRNMTTASASESGVADLKNQFDADIYINNKILINSHTHVFPPVTS